MKQLLTVNFLLMTLPVLAQSNAPNCTGARVTWNDCYGSVKFDDGDRYEGTFKSGKPHGQGTYTWASGEVYTGEFLDGNFHGRGTWTWPDGTKYVGNFKNNKSLRDGVMTFPARVQQ